MKNIKYILIFFQSFMFGQIKSDTVIYKSQKCFDCPIVEKKIIYTLLKCGLYKGSNGDISYQSEGISDIKNHVRYKIYIDWIWTDDEKDSINDYHRKMKSIIDIETFKFLNSTYWIDKKNVYRFFATSDGGSIAVIFGVDRNTFIAFDESYAKDKNNAYYRGEIIKTADAKSFKTIKNREHNFAYDKSNFYLFGDVLTKEQINEYHLERF